MEPGSFYAGLEEKPEAIIADAGSCDVGPCSLGSGTAASPEQWQRFDLEHMLRGARKAGIPMIISSCNDTGTNEGVDKFAAIIKDLATNHDFAPFKLACIRSTIDKTFVETALKGGSPIRGLAGRPDLTPEILDGTNALVPVMGAEPFVEALTMGADVILSSRSSDCCPFAGFAMYKGIPKDVAYYWGKVLECASFACEPYMAKESVLGVACEDRVWVKAVHPGQRCTPTSLASHAMYERNDPYREAVAGGEIDMGQLVYRQLDEKTTEVTGMKFKTSPEYWIKLEGAGKVGERCYAIVGVRDPHTIANIDKAVGWSQMKVEERYGRIGGTYQLYFHLYGKNAVLGELEPVREIRSHELGIVAEVIADTEALAKEIVTLAVRGIFYARLNTKGTAGGAAFLTEDPLVGSAAYQWTVNHIMRIDDPLKYFPITLEQICQN